MSEKLTSLAQLRRTAERSKELSAQVAAAAAGAIEELTASAVTMEQVNAAIAGAVGDIEAALAAV